MPRIRARSLRIAVAQLPVAGNVARNLRTMLRQIEQGTEHGAQLVHFPEAALTGYFGKDVPSLAGLDWDAVARGERALAEAAARARVWVVFGSYRRARSPKPFNCVRVLSPRGELITTYDKHFLFDRNGEDNACSPGRQLKTFSVDGIRCGLLICNDSNRESLYRRYRARGVELLLHSFYNARSTRGRTAFVELCLAQLRTRAFDHGLWISASNSCARYCPLPSCLAAPDGTVTGLQRHRTSVHVADVTLGAR